MRDDLSATPVDRLRTIDPDRARQLERYLNRARRLDPVDGWVRQTLRVLGLPVNGSDEARRARLGIRPGSNLENDDKQGADR